MQCSYKIELGFIYFFLLLSNLVVRCCIWSNKKSGGDVILKDYGSLVKMCHICEIDLPGKDCKGLDNSPERLHWMLTVSKGEKKVKFLVYLVTS